MDNQPKMFRYLETPGPTCLEYPPALPADSPVWPQKMVQNECRPRILAPGHGPGQSRPKERMNIFQERGTGQHDWRAIFK